MFEKPSMWQTKTPSLERELMQPASSSCKRTNSERTLGKVVPLSPACGAPRSHDTLRLFPSEHLTRGWCEAAVSPLIHGDRRSARPAGRVVACNDRIIRFAQDCDPWYGRQVRAVQG